MILKDVNDVEALNPEQLIFQFLGWTILMKELTVNFW